MSASLLVCAWFLSAPVRLVVGTDALGRDHVVRTTRGARVRTLPFAVVIDVQDEHAAKRLLSRLPGIRYVERDVPILVGLRAPNDPRWPEQWHLHESDVAVPETSLGLEEALLVTLGDGAHVAVVDDGFDLAHEDLHFDAGQNFADGEPYDTQVSPGPGDSHGTQTAGLIGARVDNSLGVVGVCPACELVPIRLIGGGGPADLYEIDSSVAAAAIVWAVDHGNADVINNSWGPPDGNAFSPDEVKDLWPIPTALDDAIRYAVSHGRNGKGTVVVFASGNGNELLTYDRFSSHPSVVAVGAVDAFAERAWYSDYGPGLAVVAPSSGKTGAPKLWSTDRSGTAGQAPGNYVDNFGGTSGAAALVSGVLGLVLARYPELTAAQAIEALQLSAVKVSPSQARYDTQGYSPTYGFGRVDAPGALAVAALYDDGCTFGFELCGNERDDDCNGTTDDAARCTTCIPDNGREVCDGHDNDCDGSVDEGFVCEPNDRPVCAPCQQTQNCALGNRCRPHPDIPGTHCFVDCGPDDTCPDGFTCNGEVCLLTVTEELFSCDAYLTCATPERCDGLDNDCDGTVDDVSSDSLEATNARAACSQEGVCSGMGVRCEPGGWVCERPVPWQALENRCDGLDNDCDGTIDEECANSQGCDCATGGGDPIMIGLLALAVVSLRARKRRAQLSR